MKKHFVFFFLLTFFFSFSQEKKQLSLLFMGDIMGHEPQIKSAYNKETDTYNYDEVFSQIVPIIKDNDFGIGNLEVTLAGKPYSGYPTFSSPDALAASCQKSGINILVTANNHSCDKGLKGIVRTLNVLDSLNIPHTGTFRNENERNEKNLLILEKNDIRVGILNYTYGTNGIPVPSPTIVNPLDTLLIASDIEKSKKFALDKLIAFVHWGDEYHQKPNIHQKKMADYLFGKGVDIIIGAHPHMVQPLAYFEKKADEKERFIAYSLGNFVSNQRQPNTDGGIMVKLVLEKDNNETKIAQKGYYLTWVHKYPIAGRNRYEIISCSQAQKGNFECQSVQDAKQLQQFINHTRTLFSENNIGVDEILY